MERTERPASAFSRRPSGSGLMALPASAGRGVAAGCEQVTTMRTGFELESELPPSVREAVLKPFSGDLDEIVKRRAVRLGVTFNRTFYFVDKGVQRGIAYEYGQLMERRLNKHFKTGISNKIHVIFVPLPREMLLPALTSGSVDLVAAQLPVTPEMEKYVD